LIFAAAFADILSYTVSGSRVSISSFMTLLGPQLYPSH
jgi:hypothetical protein